MAYTYKTVLFLLVVFFTTSECDQWFSSDTAKEGTFTSPNYPDPYPANVHFTYHFNGSRNERVQILFTHFDLYKHPETTRDCESADVISVFITINGQKERIDNYCGNELPPQLMSNGPNLTVEFQSLNSIQHVNGFRGIYRFVTNFGITSGKQDQESVCEFVFNSTDKSDGTITSPNYPGLYPRDTECHYLFYGNDSERVNITFTLFDIEGLTPCKSVTASDYVEFSNYRTVGHEVPRYCGLKKPKLIESDSNFFRVTFKSDDRFDGTGFKAHYQFRRQTDDTVTDKKISGTFNVAKIIGSPILYINSGDSLNLTCVVNETLGLPDYIIWYHNSKVINYDSSRGMIRIQTEKSSQTTSKLIIFKALANDSGNYSCSPSNAEAAHISVHVLSNNNNSVSSDRHEESNHLPTITIQYLHDMLITNRKQTEIIIQQLSNKLDNSLIQQNSTNKILDDMNYKLNTTVIELTVIKNQFNYFFSDKWIEFQTFAENNTRKAFIYPSKTQSIVSRSHALELCKQNNATLVDIESEEKQKLVESFLNKINQKTEEPYYWLGGYIDPLDNYKYKCLNSGNVLTYTNWHSGYPSSSQPYIYIAFNNSASDYRKWLTTTGGQTNVFCEIAFR